MRDKIKVLIITSIICLFTVELPLDIREMAQGVNPYIVSNAGETNKNS